MKKNITFLLSFLLTATIQTIQSQTLLPEHTVTGIELLGGIPPCYNLTESASVCNGEVYTFPDGSFQTITAQVMHTSTLQTVGAPCDSIIVTTVDALPTYHLSQSFFNICTGVDYTFPDGTTQTILAHTEYTSNLQTVGSLCDSIIETILNTTDISLSVSVAGNIITAQQGNAGYQWVDCDNGFAPINEANNQFYSAPFGNFAVIIYKGSCTDTSACTQIGTVGIDDVNATTVSIYPNPTNGMFKVNLGGDYRELNVIIRTITGQQIQRQTLRNVSMFDAYIEVAAGMYFMELQGSNGLHLIYKMVKE